MLIESPTSLPGGIFDVYASYKKGTADVIRWLSSNSDSGIERPYLNSIRELRHFADDVMLRGIEVPDEVIRVYRKALQARKYLTNFYKRCANGCDHEATETHSYFNCIFEEVFCDLTRCRKPTRSDHAHPSTPPSPRCSNPYLCLETAPIEPEDQQPKSHEDHGNCRPRSDKVPLPEPAVDCHCEAQVAGIEDDALDEMTYLFTHLLELDHLLSTNKNTYNDVAEGSIPLIVAASTTNATYECGKALCAGLNEVQIYNPAQFKQRYLELMQRLNIQDSSHLVVGATTLPSHLIMTQSIGPQLAWEALCQFKESGCRLSSQKICKTCGSACAGSSCDNPAEMLGYCTINGKVQPEDGLHNDHDRTCFESIIQGLYLTTKQSQAQSEGCSLGLLCNIPLVKDFLAFLQDDNGRVNHCGLCFGLYLLLESYKSYCTESNPENSSIVLQARQPRLTSLKFALSLKRTLRHTIDTKNTPCTCLTVHNRCVASLLVGCHNLLDDFITTRRFDLFYQTPWVSGEHMLEHLVRASDYGARAWHWGYYVGTILHMYNALVQTGRLKRDAIPILEKLCSVFEDTVFLGKRCNHNIVGCWQRWAGGKIKSPSHRAQIMEAGLTDKKWHICYTPDASQGGNDASRSFSPAKISLFSLLTEVPSVLDDRVLAWVYLPKEKRKNPKAKDIAKARSILEDNGPLASYVERIQAAVLAEFRGSDVPVARINYVAIYGACIQTMRRISDTNHEEDPGYICKCPAEVCLRECDAVLKRRLRASGRKVHEMPEQPYCDSCVEQLMAVFGNKNLTDFVWDL